MSDPFHVRFNIDVPIEEARRRFISRIENEVRKLAQSLDDGRHGRALDSLMTDVESKLGEPHVTHVNGAVSFMSIWRQRIGGDFYRCLSAVEKLHELVSTQFDSCWGRFIGDSLAQSETDLGITWRDGCFQKKGAELIDDKLVNEMLGWLRDPKYQNVLVPFEKGISHLLEGTKDPQRHGDAVTDMYEALEAMAKIVTGKPGEELSALREQFVSTLRLTPYHRAIMKEYIEYGCAFRHAVRTGQQRSWPLEHEAENFVYMTGLFIRLAVQAEKVGS